MCGCVSTKASCLLLQTVKTRQSSSVKYTHHYRDSMDKTLKILKIVGALVLDVFIFIVAVLGLLGVYIYGPRIIAHIIG